MSRVIPRVDISEELEDWSEAIYGEEVRSANVSALTKLQQQTNDACDMFEEIAEDFDDRDEQWAQDLQSVDESVEAAAGSASAAAASETAAAGSASAASASETAAAASQAAAASSEEASEAAAERAEEAAESVESPVSYAPQTLTPAQQQQAAENIGLGDVKASLQNIQDIISDAWNNIKTYAVGDYCIHNDTLWKCLVQNSGQEPTEGTYWTQKSVDKLIKELKNPTRISSMTIDDQSQHAIDINGASYISINAIFPNGGGANGYALVSNLMDMSAYRMVLQNAYTQNTNYYAIISVLILNHATIQIEDIAKGTAIGNIKIIVNIY